MGGSTLAIRGLTFHTRLPWILSSSSAVISSALFRTIRTFIQLKLSILICPYFGILYLTLSALELVQQRLGLGSDVELGVIVHEDDEVRVVDEPLARVVEGVAAVDLADGAGLQHPGDLGEGGLQSDVLID